MIMHIKQKNRKDYCQFICILTNDFVEKFNVMMAMLLGTPGDPFSSWLIHRGIHTASLRLPQAMHTAEKLASTLAMNPHVTHVNHPSLPDYPQKKLADRMFGENGYCAMLSFIVPEDLEKIHRFMMALRFPKYAPTLGGLHTTLSHPVTSSHMGGYLMKFVGRLELLQD